MKQKKIPTDKLKTNPFRMLFTILFFIALIVFGTISIGAQDIAWFLPGFWEKPVEVDIYNSGQLTRYLAGKPGYDQLAEAVRATLSEGINRPSGIGLSPGSVDDAYNKYLSVEAVFAYPVKVHAWFNTGTPTTMLFLITGRHTDLPMAFMGTHGNFLSNAPVLKTNEPLIQALVGLGYDTSPKE
jgi:hypothetical protein